MKNSTSHKITFFAFLIGMLVLTSFKVDANSKATVLAESAIILDNGYSNSTVALGAEGLETAVTTPTAKAATNIDRTSFQVNWSAIKGVTGYGLYVYTTSGRLKKYVTGYNPKGILGASTIKATVSGLSMNTTYYYALKAIDGVKESDLSNVISVTTLNTVPEAPVVSEATDINSTSFAISWNAVDGATSYKVYANEVDAGGYLAGYNGKVITGTSCVISGLEDNKSYLYFVRAVNAAGDSPASNIPSVTTKCAIPVATEATNVTTTSFKANWEHVDAAYYKLYVYKKLLRVVNFNVVVTKVYVAGYDPKQIQPTTSETVSGLDEGVTYYYVLKGGGSSAVESDLSTEIAVKTITAPVATAATNITSSSFTANWESAGDVDSYALYVYRKLKNPLTGVVVNAYVTGYSGKQMYPDATSYTVSGLADGTTYYYALKTADNSHNFSELSNEIEVKTLEEIPAAPVAIAATAITSTSFTANWEAVQGATSYKLSVGIRSGIGMQAIDGYNRKSLSGLGTSFVIPEGELESGKEYTYIVYAVNAGGTSEGSNWIDVTTIPAAPVATSATAITSTSFTANWEATQGATSYKLSVGIRRDAANGGGMVSISGYHQKALDGSGTSFVIPEGTLESGKEYAYIIYAVNTGGISGASNWIDVTTIPAAPVATAATDITSTSFTANWNAVDGATAYKLSILSESLGSGGVPGSVDGYSKKALSGLGTSYVVPASTLESGVEYYFVVYAVNAAGESLSSNAIIVTTVSQYTLTLSASPVAGGTVSGGGTFDDGTSVTAQATVADGYKFVKWTNSGSSVSTSSSYTFNLDANTALVAVFEEIPATQYTLSLSASPAAGGSVSGEGAYDDGTSVTVQATVAAGYTFANWTKAGVAVSSNATYTFTLNANTTLVAVFEEVITTNTLSLSAAPVAGGTVSGAETVNSGAAVAAQATANDGYAFVNWTEGGAEVSTNATYTFALNENRTLVANFRLTTGIDDTEAVELNVWPNPVSRNLNISEIPIGASIKIVSLLGQVAFQKQDCKDGEIVNVENFKSGIYLLVIENEQIRYSKKIIKR